MDLDLSFSESHNDTTIQPPPYMFNGRFFSFNEHVDSIMKQGPFKPEIVSSANPQRPLIGVPCFTHDIPDKTHPFFSIRSTYIDVLRRSGGTAFLIPTKFCEASLRRLYEIADGIMIPGGVDISPTHYGGTGHPTIQPPDTERDLVELRAC